MVGKCINYFSISIRMSSLRVWGDKFEIYLFRWRSEYLNL